MSKKEGIWKENAITLYTKTVSKNITKQDTKQENADTR